MSKFEKYSNPPFLLYSIVSGSRAYGLSNPLSDVDIRGVFCADRKEEWSINGAPEGVEKKDPTNGVDEDLWEIRKYVRLLAGCNPNIIETAWVDIEHVQYKHELFDVLLSSRDIFLSKKAETTYIGYAIAQMNKFEKSVQSGKIDWKNAMHCMRLIISVEKLFTAGEPMVKVPKDTAKWLLSIRAGEVEPKKFIDMFHRGILHVKDVAAKSTLPNEPDYVKINQILYFIKDRMNRSQVTTNEYRFK
jgi:predicted nucleotidyltransferase